MLFTNKLKRFLCVFCVVLAACLAASAQVTTSSMVGRVVDEGNEALPGAAVIAVHQPTT